MMLSSSSTSESDTDTYEVRIREMIVTHVSVFGLKRQSNNTNQGQMKHELIETYYLPVHTLLQTQLNYSIINY